jgi:hypothetical protein
LAMVLLPEAAGPSMAIVVGFMRHPFERVRRFYPNAVDLSTSHVDCT